MLTLYWPWLLLTLPLPLAIYYLMPVASTSQTALKIPFYDGLSAISGKVANRRSKLRIFSLVFVWILLVIAASRPQWIGEAQSTPVNGRDMMLAVDVSGSMKAKDMQIDGEVVNRLSAVKDVASKFISQRIGDRIGLVLFGTRAYLQAPLSFDRKTIDTLLQESAIGIAGEKTAIGDAVGLSLKRLISHYEEDSADANSNEQASVVDKVLILLTDGANTAGSVQPFKAAELAAHAKLKIYTIGVGADEMFVNSVFGQRVVNPSSDLDEDTLSAMARVTGGRYFRATDTESLKDIYALIDQLEPIEDDSKFLRPVTELFYMPLLTAAFLMLVTMLFTNPIFPNLLEMPRPGKLEQS